MYLPPMFAETDRVKLFDFIERNSFGILVSQVEGSPFSTHMPFLAERETGPHGTLVGHVARANPHWHDAAGQTGLAIFAGPHVYVSPTWYEADNMVPTWNYTAVHVTGTMRVVEDEPGLAAIVGDMVRFYEQSMPTPWTFAGETTYMKRMLSQIVGIRVEEGQALLGELIQFATQPQFIYRHKWQAGDLVIWDNRCTMHRSTPFEATRHVRDMRRTTIVERAPDAHVG